MKIKKMKKLMIVFLCAGIVFLGAAYGLYRFYAENTGFTSGVTEKTYVFDALNYINISTTNLNVEVRPIDGDRIIVEYLNDSPLIVENTDSIIRLTQDDSFTLSFLTMDMLRYKMTIHLPEKQYKQLFISTVSGNVDFSDIKTDVLEIVTKNGTINLDGTDSELSIKATDADIHCNFYALDKPVRIENTHGTAELLIPGEAKIRLSYTAKHGKLFSDLFSVHYGSWEGDLLLYNAETGATLTEFITGDGTLKIEKNISYERDGTS